MKKRELNLFFRIQIRRASATDYLNIEAGPIGLPRHALDNFLAQSLGTAFRQQRLEELPIAPRFKF